MIPKLFSEDLCFSILQIETEGGGASRCHTGFVLEYQAGDNAYPFLVTSGAAVKEASNGRITFTQEFRGKPRLEQGYTLDIENFNELWYVSPDTRCDIAITPFVPFVKHIEDTGIPVYFRCIGSAHICPAEQRSAVVPLSSMLTLGFPAGIEEMPARQPVFVPGFLASGTLDRSLGENEFLMGTTTYPGCGGAPVFALNEDDGCWYWVGMMNDAFVADEHGMRMDRRSLAQTPTHHIPFVSVTVADAVLLLIRQYLREKGFVD